MLKMREENPKEQILLFKTEHEASHYNGNCNYEKLPLRHQNTKSNGEKSLQS